MTAYCLTIPQALSLRRACALPGSLESLPLDRQDHPFYPFAAIAENDEEFAVKQTCPSTLGGITPLDQKVTTYRMPAAEKPKKTCKASTKSPKKKFVLSKPIPTSPPATIPSQEANKTATSKAIPPPATLSSQTAPCLDSNTGSKNDQEREVARRARSQILPSMSKYERERVMNIIRNQILLEELCPPRIEGAEKLARGTKHIRPASPSDEYHTSGPIEEDKPQRKSRRLMEGNSKDYRDRASLSPSPSPSPSSDRLIPEESTESPDTTKDDEPPASPSPSDNHSAADDPMEGLDVSNDDEPTDNESMLSVNFLGDGEPTGSELTFSDDLPNVPMSELGIDDQPMMREDSSGEDSRSNGTGDGKFLLILPIKPRLTPHLKNKLHPILTMFR